MENANLIKYRINFYFLIFFLCTIFSTGSGLIITNIQISISENNAAAVINSLEKYKLQNGSYPENLAQLTPMYLIEIPKTSMGLTGSDYNYIKYKKDDSYSITFNTGFFSIMKYNNDSKKWIKTD